MATQRLSRGVARIAPAAALLALAPVAAGADPVPGAVARTLAGGSIQIRSACAAAITVEPGAPPGGPVLVEAHAAHRQEIDRLTIGDGGGGIPTVDGGVLPCWRPVGGAAFRPTLTLSVRVPPGAPVTLDEQGDPMVRIGATGGPLVLSLQGASHVEAGAVGPTMVESGGAPVVSIASIDGPARFAMAGAGKVIVARIDSDQVRVEMSGSGTLALGPGAIRQAALDVSGDGTIGVRATVGDAKAVVSGSGHVDIGRISGRLDREVDGSGDVTVGD